MGTGTNVQKRLVALHHLDAPWKPAEVEQREGRILRQGNESEEVAIYRYVTEGSFDAFMWQCLQTKARFINQVMAGDGVGRRAGGRGQPGAGVTPIVMALASGNPALLVLAEQADADSAAAFHPKAEPRRRAVLRPGRNVKELLHPDQVADRAAGRADGRQGNACGQQPDHDWQPVSW